MTNATHKGEWRIRKETIWQSCKYRTGGFRSIRYILSRNGTDLGSYCSYWKAFWQTPFADYGNQIKDGETLLFEDYFSDKRGDGDWITCIY